MQEKQSKQVAESFLVAQTASDIQKVMQDDHLAYYFDNQSNWQPYGGRPKYWDIVGNQQAKAVVALVELITNGID